MFNMSAAFFHSNENASLSRCIDAFSFPTVLPPTALGEPGQDTRGDRATILDAAQTIETAAAIGKPKLDATVSPQVLCLLEIEQAVANGRRTLTTDEYAALSKAVLFIFDTTPRI